MDERSAPRFGETLSNGMGGKYPKSILSDYWRSVTAVAKSLRVMRLYEEDEKKNETQ